VGMGKWNTSLSPLASYFMPNKWFDELELFNLETVSVGNVPSMKVM
jgi:hypothetical protein